MKKILAVTMLVMILLGTVLTNASGETITINGVKYMLSDVESFTDISMIEKQAQNLYKALSGFPKVKSYVYLVNSSRTVDLKKDVTAVPGIYPAIQKYFSKSTTEYLHLDSLEQYADFYYASDHHWNYRGSYTGYCDIIRINKKKKEPVLEPKETVTFPVKFNGSMNSRGGDSSGDQFVVYRFDYPKMKIEVNGVRQASYGNQETYFAGKIMKQQKFNHYSKFYGGDYGLIHFETDRTDRGSLVLFSNSFSNAINLLLASHFHHLWVIDFRYFLPEQNKAFHLSDILAQKDVKVLILGDGQYCTQNKPYQKLR